jgi:hypothetical protein
VVIREKDITLAWGQMREDGYLISLYYSEPGVEATLGAGFGGSTRRETGMNKIFQPGRRFRRHLRAVMMDLTQYEGEIGPPQWRAAIGLRDLVLCFQRKNVGCFDFVIRP